MLSLSHRRHTVGVVMSEQKAKFTANLSNLTAENQQLVMKNSNLESKTEELSRDRDDLNWTLTVILKFNSFPVDKYCPQKREYYTMMTTQYV